jgi:pyruvate dehydrogenase (quinone)/pyruvate oxidase
MSRAPSTGALERAAAVLTAGRKIAILAGRGALGARTEVRAIAERLAAPVAKALLGKGAMPDADPYCIGGVGLLGTKPAHEALSSCDTLLIIGSSFPYIEYYPKPGNARAVQIDLDPQRIGLRYPAEVGLVGDAATIISGVMPLLKGNSDRAFLDKAQAAMKDWNKLMEERATRRDFPMKPQVVAHELGKLLPRTAILAADSGTNTTWCARHIPIRDEQLFSVSGNLATMACGLPYAIAAAIAYPDRMAVAFVGDGGLTMLMGELATCVKYDLNVKIVVVKNDTLGQIKWEQMIFLGNPEYGCTLQPIDFAAVARACGAQGFRIERAEDCATILAQALKRPGPVLIEAVVDPNEPPMPPHATLADAANLAKALMRGTPGRDKIFKTIVRDTARELI